MAPISRGCIDGRSTPALIEVPREKTSKGSTNLTQVSCKAISTGSAHLTPKCESTTPFIIEDSLDTVMDFPLISIPEPASKKLAPFGAFAPQSSSKIRINRIPPRPPPITVVPRVESYKEPLKDLPSLITLVPRVASYKEPLKDLPLIDLPPLPDDLKFKNLIDPQIKENERGFLFEVSNERNCDETLEYLKTIDKVDNGVYLGFSTWFNYDVIALRNPEIAFVCDISNPVFSYYSAIRKIVLESDTKEEFVRRFSEIKISEFKNPTSVADALSMDKRFREAFLKEASKPNSWLRTDKSYKCIRDMYKTNRILHVRLDAADEKGNFQILSKWIDDHSYTLDVAYFSNISSWVTGVVGGRKGNVDAFIKNISSIIRPDTIYLDSGLNETGRLWQRRIRSQLPLPKKDDLSKVSKESFFSTSHVYRELSKLVININ